MPAPQPSENAHKTDSLVRGLALARLDSAARLLARAKSDNEFAQIGESCAEVLLLLAVAIFDRDRHLASGGKKLRLTDAPKQLLDAYIATEFAGEANQPIADSIKSNLQLVDSLHDKTRTYQNAKLCLKSAEYVVDAVAVRSGLRDATATVADLCESYIENTENIGVTHRYALLALARRDIARKIAARLTAQDVIEHVEKRRKVAGPATVNQDLVYLRGVLKAHIDRGLQASLDALEHAARILREKELVGASTPRNRRPTRAELAYLVSYFEKQDKDWRTKIPMKEIMDFALWSARPIGEICQLRWEDLDEKKRTCKVRGLRGGEFPLLGKAWDIVQRQERKNDLIFPYNAKSCSVRYTEAKKQLGIKNLRFQDLRREAAIRLAEAGFSVEEISKVTGRMELNSLLRDIKHSQTDRAESEQVSLPL